MPTMPFEASLTNILICIAAIILAPIVVFVLSALVGKMFLLMGWQPVMEAPKTKITVADGASLTPVGAVFLTPVEDVFGDAESWAEAKRAATNSLKGKPQC